jgi:serine/threonine-protein kinase
MAVPLSRSITNLRDSHHEIACGFTWASSSYTSRYTPSIRPPLSRNDVPETTTPLACAHCHTPLQPEERFCSSCGTPVGSGAIDESPWAGIVSQLSAATLGEFEVTRELGRGGMAAVYLAHEIALNRLVAIKVMAPGLFLGPGMVDRFRQEAVTVANLSHPNIITIHGVRQIEDLHFLVMKFIEGRSVEAVLASHGPLPVAAVRAMLFHVGSGLAYAHRRGVIHRDVKPANILLDADGNSIVTDFGIAKLIESDGHTQTGTMVGTPSYMSPEQCVGNTLTWSSDLYSLGIVAYQLLTGTVPFTGNAFAVMQAHTMTPPPPIGTRRSDCPPDLEAAVLRMLAKDPVDRYASMADALNALGALPTGEGDPVRPLLGRLAMPDPSARHASVIRPPVSPIPLAGPRVGRLSINGAPDIIAAGDRFPLHTAVRSDAGATLTGRAVSWSSSDDGVAAVTANGVVSARAPGRVNITATCEGVLASLPVTVLPAGTGKRARRWVAPAGIVAVLLAASGGWALLHERDRTAVLPRATGAVAQPDTTPHPAQLPTASPSAQIGAPGPLSSGHATSPQRDTAESLSRARKSAGKHAADSTAGALASGVRAQGAVPPGGVTSVVTPPPAPVATAISTAPIQAPPAQTTATPSVPPPAPPPPSPAEISNEARATVTSYVAAMRARSIDQMRRIYPGLTGDRATEWQTQFNMVGHDGVQSLDVRQVGDIKVTPSASGESAVATFTLALVLTQRRGDSQSSQIAFRAALLRDTDGWHIDALEQRAVR